MVALSVASTPLPQSTPLQTVRDTFSLQRDIRTTLLMLAARGDVTRFPVLPHAFFINAPDLLAGVLVDSASLVDRSDFDRAVIGRYLGESLVTMQHVTPTGLTHRQARQMFAPLFTPKASAQYAEAMQAEAQATVAAWGDGATIELHDVCVQMTSRMIISTLCGQSLAAEDAIELQDAVTAAAEVTLHRARQPVRLPLSWPLPAHRAFLAACERIDVVMARIIAARRLTVQPEDTDVLAAMLRFQASGDPDMTDIRIRDELITFFQGAHDATANALTWTYWVLTQHPAIYERMIAEIDAAVGDRPVTAADIAQLPYLTMVIKESLRLNPPQWVQNRQVIQPLTLRNYDFPVGSLLMFSPYTLHRRPDIYPDPERFDPERFTPAAEKRLPRLAYMPFGGGPRVCIGGSVAMLMMQISMATFAQHLRFTSLDDSPVIPRLLFSLRPGRPIPMRVTRRGAQ